MPPHADQEPPSTVFSFVSSFKHLRLWIPPRIDSTFGDIMSRLGLKVKEGC